MVDEDMNRHALYEGESIRIGGREYIVPGLSLGQVEQMADRIETLSKSTDQLSKEMIQTVSEICHAALSRNYPHLTLEEIKNMLDMRNMAHVLETVMGATGFVKGALAGGNGAQGATLKRG